MAGQLSRKISEASLARQTIEDEARGLDDTQARYESALADAFSFGYCQEYDELSERTVRLHNNLVALGVPFEFAEAKGGMAGLIDKLFMRRDRMEHSAVLAVLKWVQRLAAVLPIAILYKILTDEHGDARADSLAVLQGLLSEYPELATDLKNIVADVHAKAAAEGTVAAGAVINQFHGIKVPDLDTTHSSELNANKKSDSYWTGAELTMAAILGGLAGDLATHVGHLLKEKPAEGTVQTAISSTVKAGEGASFYIGAAAHSFYGNAQLVQIASAGEKVDWISSGDDRVCARCLANEGGNPYTVDNVPPVPDHPGCRCLYHAAGAIT